MAVLPAELVRNNPSDTYALLDELVLRGGYRTVADTTARDAIYTDVRKIGMLVYCSTPDTFYQLKGGITNGDWAVFSGGSSFDGNPSSLNQEGATDGQAIVWNNSAGEWQPQNQSGGGFSGDITDLNQTGATDRQIVLWNNSAGEWQPTTILYSDVSGTPTLAAVATSGDYSDLIGAPSLATVATSGAYADLSGTPTLATVATTGDYNDLSNKPTIPTPFSGNPSDLNQEGATDTQVITWNNSAGEWQPASIPSGATPTLQQVANEGSSANISGSPFELQSDDGTVNRLAFLGLVQTQFALYKRYLVGGTNLVQCIVTSPFEEEYVMLQTDGDDGTSEIRVEEQGILVTLTTPLSGGFRYNADYSSVFTSRSIIDKGYADGQKATKTSNYTILTSDFRKQPSEIKVGNNSVTLTLGAITPTDGTRLEINLYHASGSISLDFSAATVIDSEAAALTSPLTVQAVVLIYDSTLDVFKMIGKYS